jgi:hypothetical protein
MVVGEAVQEQDVGPTVREVGQDADASMPEIDEAAEPRAVVGPE